MLTLLLGAVSGSYLSGFPTKMLYAFIISLIRGTPGRYFEYYVAIYIFMFISMEFTKNGIY
jgi:hypothetical protein